ncbi:MAG TPA: response regulator [Candidatus Wallbacteria bacterium]|nr:response regulator [Candidatus Wallbacteria bacterium]
MINGSGNKFEVADNGTDAIKMFKDSISSGTLYDIIFMDMQMPEMDGLEATRLIRSEETSNGELFRVPIIAMTANVTMDDRRKCFEAGMDDFLAKPVKNDVVTDMIKKWCFIKNA